VKLKALLSIIIIKSSTIYHRHHHHHLQSFSPLPWVLHSAVSRLRFFAATNKRATWPDGQQNEWSVVMGERV